MENSILSVKCYQTASYAVEKFSVKESIDTEDFTVLF